MLRSCEDIPAAHGSSGFSTATFPPLLAGDEYSCSTLVARLDRHDQVTEGDPVIEYTGTSAGHPQFANPGTSLTTPICGPIISTSVSPRVVPFALKYSVL